MTDTKVFFPGDVVTVGGVVTQQSAHYVYVQLDGINELRLFKPEDLTFIRPMVEVGMSVAIGGSIYEVKGINGDTAWIYSKLVGNTFAPLTALGRVVPEAAPEPELPLQPAEPDPYLEPPLTAAQMVGIEAMNNAAVIEPGERPDPFKVSF